MTPEIPDFIPPDLADILRARAGEDGLVPVPGIPAINFSEESPSEMSLLLAMILHNAGTKPEHKQFVLLLQMVVSVLSNSYQELLEKAAKESGPARVHTTAIISHLATSMAIVEFIVDRVADCYKSMFGLKFEPKASAAFLTSLGLSPDDFATWVESMKTGAEKKGK